MQVHAAAAGVVVLSSLCRSCRGLPKAPGCTEPLEAKVLKNVIKCGRVDMTAAPLRALTAVRKDFASPC